jgi:hypothetical protein
MVQQDQRQARAVTLACFYFLIRINDSTANSDPNQTPPGKGKNISPSEAPAAMATK